MAKKRKLTQDELQAKIKLDTLALAELLHDIYIEQKRSKATEVKQNR